MSDTSKVGLYFVEETVWGTTPASALQTLRKTSVNFRPTLQTAESQEIIDDAQLADLILTQAAAEGDYGLEMSYGTYDLPFEGLLRADWPASAVSLSGSTFAAAATGNKFTDSANGFITGGVLAGQIIKVAGFTTAANNGYFTVVSRIAGEMVVAGATLVDEIAGDAITMKGTGLLNGTTAKSYTFEQKFVNESGTSHFISYTGYRFGGASFSFTPGSIATGSMNGIAKAALSGAATVGTGGPTAATTTSVMNCIGDVKWLQENDITIQLTKLDMTIDNGLRQKAAIGTSALVGIGQGQFKVTGSLQVYMEDRTLLDKAIAQTASSISMVVADAAGNTYGFSLPQVKFGQPDMPTSGNNQDLMLTLPFTAMKDPVLAKTMCITRIPA